MKKKFFSTDTLSCKYFIYLCTIILNISIMSNKKSYKASVEKRKVIFFLLGLIVPLFLSFVCLDLLAFPNKHEVTVQDDPAEIIVSNELVMEEKQERQPETQVETQEKAAEIVFKEVANTATQTNIQDLFTDFDESTVIEDLPTVVEVVEEVPEEEAPPVLFAQEQPEFPGGTEALNNFLKTNIKYPTAAVDARVQGTVMVEFVVERDGRPSNIRILSSLFNACDEEAIRVIKSMPKWKPGKNNGNPVRVFYNIPITFTLQ